LTVVVESPFDEMPPVEPDQVSHAVVLLSGGLDSATVLAIAQAEGFDVHALSFRYGQRHVVEVEAACALAVAAGVTDHRVADIDLRIFGGSALTADIDVPKHDSVDHLDPDEIPVTYVPARNTVFLSYAVAFAEVIGATHIFVGVNALDYSGYPDCRPEYLRAFEVMANLATRAGVEGSHLTITAPLIDLTKAEIITRGAHLGVDYASTLSCYDPIVGPDRPLACGRCDSCLLRARGFADAAVDDPTHYA